MGKKFDGVFVTNEPRAVLTLDAEIARQWKSMGRSFYWMKYPGDLAGHLAYRKQKLVDIEYGAIDKEKTDAVYQATLKKMPKMEAFWRKVGV